MWAVSLVQQNDSETEQRLWQNVYKCNNENMYSEEPVNTYFNAIGGIN